MNYLVFDIESTGLSAEKNAMVQLAALPVINGVEGEPFVSYLRPHPDAVIDPGALKVNRLEYDQLWTFPEPSEVLKNFIDWVDGHETLFALMGHNVPFDRKFLYMTLNRNMMNMEYITRFRTTDFCTLEMARTIFKGKRNAPEKMNLTALCKFFQIPFENAHDALADIKATYAVFLRLQAMMPPKAAIEVVKKMSYQEKRRKYIDSKYIQFNEDGSFYGSPDLSKNPDAARFIAEEIYHLFGS